MVEKEDSESKTPKKDEKRTYETLIMFLCSVIGMEIEQHAKALKLKAPKLIRYNVMGEILDYDVMYQSTPKPPIPPGNPRAFYSR